MVAKKGVNKRGKGGLNRIRAKVQRVLNKGETAHVGKRARKKTKYKGGV